MNVECLCGRWICATRCGYCHDCDNDEEAVIACQEKGMQPEYTEAIAWFDQQSG